MDWIGKQRGIPIHEHYGIDPAETDADLRQVRNLAMPWDEVKRTMNPLLDDGFEGMPDRLVGFRGPTACQVVGITYRQLDYWARTDLIRPSLADARGSGSRRRYSYRDLLELKLVKTLLDDGIKLESIREAFGYLRDQLGDDLSTVKLVISGNSAVLVRENDELDL